jgi:predicted DNA-binding transcriptional regulator YafY
MERHWHDSQKFIPLEDGGAIMELQVANLWEVKRWLIGWGADAKVIEPQSLLSEVREECETILQMDPLL